MIAQKSELNFTSNHAIIHKVSEQFSEPNRNIKKTVWLAFQSEIVLSSVEKAKGNKMKDNRKINFIPTVLDYCQSNCSYLLQMD